MTQELSTRSVNQLPTATQVSGVDITVFQQANITKQVAFSTILNYVEAAFPVFTFNTLTQMRAYTPDLTDDEGKLVYLKGRTVIGDGGRGFFLLTLVNPGADDDGFVIAMTTGTCWAVRQPEKPGETDVQWYGAGTSTDDAQAIQRALNRRGVINFTGAVTVGATINYNIGSSRTYYDNTSFRFKAGSRTQSTYMTSTVDWQQSVFKNEFMPSQAIYISTTAGYTQTSTNHNISFIGEGGILAPTSASKAQARVSGFFTPPLIAAHFCKNVSMLNLIMETPGRNVCITTNSKRVALNNSVLIAGACTFEGGFWPAGGSVTTFTNNIFETGDDCVGVGSNYNLKMNYITYGPNSYKTDKGNWIQPTQNRLGSTSAFPTPTNVIRGGSGVGGTGMAGKHRNHLINFDCTISGSGSGKTDPSLIDTWTWTGFTADHGVSVPVGTANHDAIGINGGTNIFLQGQITTPYRNAARVVGDATGITLLLDSDGSQTNATPTVYVSGCGIVTIGGRLATNNADGVRAINVDQLNIQNLTVTNLQNDTAGVNYSGNTNLNQMGYRAFKASAAVSTSFGFACNTSAGGSTFLNGPMLNGVDRPMSLSFVPSLLQTTGILAAPVSLNISGGTIVTRGDSAILLGAATSTATLNTITGGYAGQILNLTLPPSFATTRIVTVSGGGGAANEIVLTSAITGLLLNSGNRGLQVINQNDRWVERSRWGF